MSTEDFQLIEETIFDISFLKRDFGRIYHQQGANLLDFD